MFTILFFTVVGFLAGLCYVMVKRKIKPGSLLSAAFLSILSWGIWKILKDYSSKTGRKKRYF